MKDTETKLAFVKLRAEGKSYSTITKELGIAKATCSNWEHELRGDIEAMKRARLEELYTSYNMTRQARIEALGGILGDLDKAIADKPLEEIPLEKLLELRLKYARELKEEYVEPVEIETDNTLEGLLEQYDQLYIDSKTGKYSPSDIKAQLSILDAKRDTMYRLAGELDKEGKNPFDVTFDTEAYRSRVIRHEEGREA